jgi:transcription termination factor NusB
MSARRKARKRALDILFSADVREMQLADALAIEAQRAASEPDRESSWLYAREIVDGVIDHTAEIDDFCTWLDTGAHAGRGSGYRADSCLGNHVQP